MCHGGESRGWRLGAQVIGRCGWCVQVRGIIPQILDGRVGGKVGEILTRSENGCLESRVGKKILEYI